MWLWSTLPLLVPVSLSPALSALACRQSPHSPFPFVSSFHRNIFTSSFPALSSANITIHRLPFTARHFPIPNYRSPLLFTLRQHLLFSTHYRASYCHLVSVASIPLLPATPQLFPLSFNALFGIANALVLVRLPIRRFCSAFTSRLVTDSPASHGGHQARVPQVFTRRRSRLR